MSNFKDFIKFLNPFYLFTLIQTGLMKFVFILGMFILLILGVQFAYSSIISGIDSYNKHVKVQDYMEGFYEKVENGDISGIDESLKGFLGFTDDELKELSQQEKVIEAVSAAINLAVFDFDITHISELDGTPICSIIENFDYAAEFDNFVVNKKWQGFYDALSVFSGTSTYEYTYFSNVYIKGTQFPLQYFEDEKFTVKYTDNWLDARTFIQFEDTLEIVLMDKDDNKIADNAELNFVYAVVDITNDKQGDFDDVYSEIALKVENGDLKFRSPVQECSITQRARYLE